MTQNITNEYYRMLIGSIRGGLIVLCSLLVMALMIHITTGKFDSLRAAISSQDVTGATTAERTKQLECLARNIYWEAASEPFEGKVAVAQVTMNRVDSGNFGNGVCGVVFQKNIIYEKVICQFSWVCDKVSKVRPIHPKLYAESEEVAKKVLLENFRLPSLTSAMYYHASYVNPGWRKERIVQIGNHIFYKG